MEDSYQKGDEIAFFHSFSLNLWTFFCWAQKKELLSFFLLFDVINTEKKVILCIYCSSKTNCPKVFVGLWIQISASLGFLLLLVVLLWNCLEHVFDTDSLNCVEWKLDKMKMILCISCVLIGLCQIQLTLQLPTVVRVGAIFTGN